jgi:hypothetical protein
MKFTDKYELLETLTTGAVETFVANDKIRGERVLVHIVDCAPQKPNQSAMEWVLESFRQLAPGPVGPVLETGKYSGAQYGYLVTKAPDEAAEKAWARRYELQSQDTQETIPARTKIDLEKIDHAKIDTLVESSTPPAAKPVLPAISTPPIHRESSSVPVSVTQFVREFDSQMKPPGKPKEPAMAPSPALPGINLGQGQSGLHSAPPWVPVHKPISPKIEEPVVSGIPSRPLDSPGSEYNDRSMTFSLPPSPAKEPKPGEFTSFFQGPFRGEPSDVPVVSSLPIEPPPKKVGDFTAMFGAVGTRPEPSANPVDASGIGVQPPGFTGPSFTGVFRDFKSMESAQSFGSMPSSPTPAGSLPGSVLSPQPVETIPPTPNPQIRDPFPASTYVAPPPPIVPSHPPIIPLPPTPNIAAEKPPAMKPSSLPGDGATGAFTNPAANHPVPLQPQMPVGPSPYTQIISREKLMAPDAEAEEAAAKSSAAGGFAMPKLPPLTPPKAPQIKMPPAPKPKLAVPKPPKLPNVDEPAPPPVSYMPLIITLAVLFILAVVVVLFLVLKH